jgi:cold shock CspA family protein
MIGVIKLFNKQNCDGCVMADDGGDAMFFHRECVSPDYQPKVGDRVTFTTRASPRTGSLEAYRIAPLVKSAA